jgi:PAS domain S-box-containing protein/putative nucleotidyltransferase with HDIG domain
MRASADGAISVPPWPPPITVVMASMLQHTDWLNGRVPDAVRARLRQLVEVVGYLPHQQPLAVITADAVLLAANRPFLDLLGASDDELLGADWDDFMPGWSVRAGVDGGGSPRCGSAREPGILAFEDYALAAGGEPVWVRAVACPVFTPGVGDETEEALCAWALFVLDRRPGKADADEHRRRSILELLLESPSEFVVQLAPDGRVEYVSHSLRRTLGVFGDGIEGEPLAAVHELIGDEFAGRFAVMLERLLAPPYQVEFEMTMTTAGAQRVVQWRFESLLGDGAAVLGILGVGHDVTERRRAEGELERSELRLRSLVESTNQLIWMTAPGGEIDGAFDSWSAFTGQTESEVQGEGWLQAIHPDDRERVRRSWESAVQATAPYGCEYRLRGADGEYRWIEARAVPLPDDGDRPRYFGVGHDISERRAAEDAVRRRARLESMAAAVSARLAAATLDTAGLAGDFALSELGCHLGADGVDLCVLTPDGTAAESLHEWRRETGVVESGAVPEGFERLVWLRETALEGRPLVIRSADDLPADAEAERELFAARGMQAALVVPLLQETALVGVLSLVTLTPGGAGAATHPGTAESWSEEDVDVVRLVGDQLTRLLVSSWDERNLRGIADCFLAFGPEVEGNLTQICRAAGKITAADAVLYTRRRGEDLYLEAWWHLPDGVPRVTSSSGRLDSDLFDHPDEQVRIVRQLQDSIYAHTSPVIASMRAQTYAGFPVQVAGKAVATLSCLFHGDAPLRESQLELMRVLGRAAAVEEERRRAIEDRVLGLAQLEQAMERTVATLSTAVGSRDPYTVGHERRVADLCSAIGAELGMDPSDLRLLRLAATVHDIGKITLPAEILSKPTKLSEAEYRLIQAHSQAGWEMLEPAGLPASVTDAVRQHQERLDGTGYPEGLSGDAIGEFARIVAVADVVEAMSSHRPYRPAIGMEAALQEIEEGRGVCYDERAADACIRVFRERGFAFSAEPAGPVM